ncbi:MAG: acetate kinase [Candidatus Delongbacteria bacterium]|nr:acetate kinase [Candidatus Delongbacteria bacterium]MBN2834193.1 acetate kinase [Candidatus Delongbacteria bacterium]
MKVLVINCGSSSIKYQLFNMDENERVLASGLVDKIGLKGSVIKHKKENGEKVEFEGDILDHQSGIGFLFGILTSEKHGCLSRLDEIDAVGHRVAHGGESFKTSAFLDDDAIKKIEDLIVLAPLHNPPNLKGIYAIKAHLPNTPQVAVFDTTFHQSMPEHSYMYAIPYSLYEKYRIRRYGFHGTSHRFVAKHAAEELGKNFEDLKIITCHLGNGASICAIKDGKSMDTSMGFTPVEGLIMGTRCGDLDIGAVTYIMQKEEIGFNQANTLINKHSGMLGVSGVSSDMRDLEEAAWEKKDHRAQLALDMFAYRVRKYIGSYAAVLGGLDLLIFTGGIGENGPEIREIICKDFEYLGLQFAQEKNDRVRGKIKVISSDDSNVTAMVYPTNEELVIAQDTAEIVNSMK